MATTPRTRFAPSPTGDLHIGGARTALFAWAYARHFSGEFLLRIEDSDRARHDENAADAILEAMAWLSLDFDGAPVYQSQRFDQYSQIAHDLVERDLAYYCYMSSDALDALRAEQRAQKQTPKYDGTWRPEPGKILPAIPPGHTPVIRLKMPDQGTTCWHDAIKGRIEIANETLDDFIILRADDTPTYNFCVAIDDADMAITNVIRGDDHVSNTPKQLHVLQAIGAPLPNYAHVAMIHGADGSKLSKRHGAAGVLHYKQQGYLPEALINYIARLGWAHGDDEIFSLEQFTQWFSLNHISPSPARFDYDKLGWLNQHYLAAQTPTALAEQVAPLLEDDHQISTENDRATLAELCVLYQPRCQTLIALRNALKRVYQPDAADETLIDKHLNPATMAGLQALYQALTELDDWNAEAIQTTIKHIIKHYQLNMPKVAMPLRLALTGTDQTPAINALAALLPRTVVLSRIQTFITKHHRLT